MLRTVRLLPLAGLLTLGFDPTRFQTEPPVCYRASWQLPEPDSHRLATTSFRSGQSYSIATSRSPGRTRINGVTGYATLPRHPLMREIDGWLDRGRTPHAT